MHLKYVALSVVKYFMKRFFSSFRISNAFSNGGGFTLINFDFAIALAQMTTEQFENAENDKLHQIIVDHISINRISYLRSLTEPDEIIIRCQFYSIFIFIGKYFRLYAFLQICSQYITIERRTCDKLNENDDNLTNFKT